MYDPILLLTHLTIFDQHSLFARNWSLNYTNKIENPTFVWLKSHLLHWVRSLNRILKGDEVVSTWNNTWFTSVRRRYDKSGSRIRNNLPPSRVTTRSHTILPLLLGEIPRVNWGVTPYLIIEHSFVLEKYTPSWFSYWTINRTTRVDHHEDITCPLDRSLSPASHRQYPR